MSADFELLGPGSRSLRRPRRQHAQFSYPPLRELGAEDALAYGVKFTGATLFFVDPGVDTGRVIAQCVVPVEAHDTVAELLERIQIERKQLVTTVGRMMRDGWTSTAAGSKSSRAKNSHAGI